MVCSITRFGTYVLCITLQAPAPPRAPAPSILIRKHIFFLKKDILSGETRSFIIKGPISTSERRPQCISAIGIQLKRPILKLLFLERYHLAGYVVNGQESFGYTESFLVMVNFWMT